MDRVVVLPKGTWEPAGSGESDTEVFRRGDGAVYAKCAAPRGIEELRAERDRVAWLSGTGLPGAEVADWIETGDGACLITTTVPGIPAVDLPPPSRLKGAEVLAEALRALHAIEDCPFTRPLAEMVDTATDVVRRGAVNPAFLTDEWRRERPEDLLAQIRADQPYAEQQATQDLVVCHGDPCLPNVLLDPGTLELTGFIDVGRLGLADRYADLALATAQLGDEWDLDPTPFHAAYGLDVPDWRRLVFYRLLDSLSWG